MESIIIAPFCLNAMLLYHGLKLQNTNVDLFFDKNAILEGMKYDNTFIMQYWYKPNTKIILCSDVYNNDIRNQLLELGYENKDIIDIKDYPMPENYLENAVRKIDESSLGKYFGGRTVAVTSRLRKLRRFCEIGIKLDSQMVNRYEGWLRDEIYTDEKSTHIILKRLEIDVTSRCTLRCKNCANMMQYFKTPTDISQDTIVNDFERMMQIIDWTDEILFIGGEPLLYSGLENLLERIYRLTKDKVGEIQLVTNGTLIPNQKVLDAMRKVGCVVYISNYREKSIKISELVSVLHENGICFKVLDIRYWADVQQYVERKESLSLEYLLKNRSSLCDTLHRVVDSGKFYLCCHIKSLDILGAIPDDNDTYVDIYADDAKERIVKYLDRNSPLPKACSWCNGNSRKMWKNTIPVAEQSAKVLEYIKFK